MRKDFLIFLFLTFCICGCSFFSHKPKEIATAGRPDQLFKVVDAAVFQNGGKLLISAFRAGSGVEASAELDKTAFMIIKGFDDTLKENNSKIVVLGEDGAETADFIMEGHINQMAEPSTVKKWVALGAKKRLLAVNGKIISRSTGKELVIFSDTVEAVDKRIEYKHLGEVMGQNLAGKFLKSIQK